MDLRFDVFNLIDRDQVLRSLLMAYADHLDGRVPDGTAAGDSFLALQWTPADPDAADGSEVLTAFAHTTRRTTAGLSYLDFVLQRLQTAVSDDTASTRVSSRCTETSNGFMDAGGDTVFKTSTFEFTPAAALRDGCWDWGRHSDPAPLPVPRATSS